MHQIHTVKYFFCNESLKHYQLLSTIKVANVPEPLSVKHTDTNLTREGRLETDPHKNDSHRERTRANTWHQSMLLCVNNMKMCRCRKWVGKTSDDDCKPHRDTSANGTVVAHN